MIEEVSLWKLSEIEANWRATCRDKRTKIGQIRQNLFGFQVFCWENIKKLSDGNQKHRIWRAKFSAGLPKPHSTCPEERFGKCKSQIYNFFGISMKKFYDSQRKFFEIVNNVFYDPIGTIWGSKKKTWTCSLQIDKFRRKKSTYWGKDFLFV